MNPMFLLVSCLLAVSGVFADVCYQDASMECGLASNSLELSNCNAVYGNYGRHGNVASEMQAYANLHIERSYQYLLSPAFFDNYNTNRKGFSALFKKLSDHAWSKSIELIQHITKRGDVMDFSRRSTLASTAKNVTLELPELESLAHALDTQKEMAERAFYIHREATRNSQKTHDPEIAQYLEEEFVEYQAKVIRDLAGHTTDLKKFVVSNKGQDLSLALYLFDEYLQKSV
uniref:Ferritin n=1 Tax=Calpodes ethlius TaxID=73634 RepID=Q9TVI4_CALET|nr:secreted ferritin G subunit precursor [Calpodes ethlius]AAD50241.1 secreted ferritin G subunit precursor [Calpodes ethlius]